MTEDPIVAEVPAARATLLAESGGDLDALFDLLEQRQRAGQREAQSLPPRRARWTASPSDPSGHGLILPPR